MKSSLFVLLQLLALLAARSSFAQQPPDPKDAARDTCVSAFDAAQASREAGKLLAARDSLVTCAQADCPSIIAGKCNEWLTELEQEVPSIVIAVQPAPAQIAAIVVVVDGTTVDGGLTGRALPLDPGKHDVLVTFPDGTERRLEVVVAQGEQNRKVVITIETAPTPDPSPAAKPSPVEESSISPLAWIGFAIAGAGAIVGGVTGGIAITTADQVEDDCGGFRCDTSFDDDLSRGEAFAHVSTVSFAIAGAGLVLGVVGLFVPGSQRDDDAALSPWLDLGAGGIRGHF